MKASRAVAALLVLGFLGANSPVAADEGKAPPEPAPAKKVENVPEKEAKDALEKFEQSFATEDLDFKVEAVERLRKTIHPLVAERLLAIATKDTQPLVRAAAYRGLGLQKPSKSTVGPKLARMLSQAAKEGAQAKARGDYGVRIDPKTGEVDTESPEGKAALRAKRERGKMLAEAVRALDTLGHRERDSVESLLEFMSDGNDDLVAYCIGMLGKWKEWSVLPNLLDLFEMYPKEHEFATGSTSVDTGAAGSEDQNAAKRKWMAKYGDPDRRRPRPAVHRAIKKTLLDITGQEFAEPAEVREYMKRPEVKRKMRYGGN